MRYSARCSKYWPRVSLDVENIMQALGITLGAMLGVLSVGIAQASETFVPEVLTVEKAIKPGANVFVLDQTWKGASRINVLSADDLEHKGILSVGITGQMVYSKDRKTAYAMSAYATRITYRPAEAVLQEVGGDTLTLKFNTVTIGTLTFTGTWPFGTGESMHLKASKHDATSNNTAANWCKSTTAAGNGEKGSPGAAESGCP